MIFKILKMQHEDLIFSNPFIVPYIEAQFNGDGNPLDIGRKPSAPNQQSSLSGKSEELSPEELRKLAFIQQLEIKNEMKVMNQSTVPDVNVKTINDDLKQGVIILSPKIIETLIYKGNTLLNSANPSVVQSEELLTERDETFEEKLEVLRKLLRRLKAEKPLAFQELLSCIENHKQNYETFLRDPRFATFPHGFFLK